MVLVTLHTRSAEGAVPRLLNLGVPEHLIEEVLVGVLSQELRVNEAGDGRVLGYEVNSKPGKGIPIR